MFMLSVLIIMYVLSLSLVHMQAGTFMSSEEERSSIALHTVLGDNPTCGAIMKWQMNPVTLCHFSLISMHDSNFQAVSENVKGELTEDDDIISFEYCSIHIN